MWRGHAATFKTLLGSVFNYLGPYSDALREVCNGLRFLVTEGATLEGGIRTPHAAQCLPHGPLHAPRPVDLARLEAFLRTLAAAP